MPEGHIRVEGYGHFGIRRNKVESSFPLNCQTLRDGGILIRPSTQVIDAVNHAYVSNGIDEVVYDVDIRTHDKTKMSLPLPWAQLYLSKMSNSLSAAVKKLTNIVEPTMKDDIVFMALDTALNFINVMKDNVAENIPKFPKELTIDKLNTVSMDPFLSENRRSFYSCDIASFPNGVSNLTALGAARIELDSDLLSSKNVDLNLLEDVELNLNLGETKYKAINSLNVTTNGASILNSNIRGDDIVIHAPNLTIKQSDVSEVRGIYCENVAVVRSEDCALSNLVLSSKCDLTRKVHDASRLNGRRLKEHESLE